MAMSESDIQTGWIYRTSNNQERLVLGRDRDGRVVYVSKGRNEAAPFRNCHVRITPKRFAQRAIGKLRQVEDVRPFIIANKATTVVLRESVRPAAKAAAEADVIPDVIPGAAPDATPHATSDAAPDSTSNG